MKAVIYERYGSPDVLELKEIGRPVPKADEVLVETHAAALNAYDWHLLRADPFLVRLEMGFWRPSAQILGADIAGRVVEVGSRVTQFDPGDEVFGDISAYGAGGFAEYVAVPESGLVLKPSDLSFEEAAAAPMAALTALKGLRDKGGLQAGERVLINGASGGVGTFAVQIAKALGGEVTAVCSTRKLDQTRELGADHVIDYTRDDFAKNGARYDLVLGINGYRPLSTYRRVLAPEGRYVMVGGTNAQIFEGLLLSPLHNLFGRQKFSLLSYTPNQTDLTTVKDLIEEGLVRVVIDKIYPLEELPDAIRYLEQGQASGKVVIRVK